MDGNNGDLIISVDAVMLDSDVIGSSTLQQMGYQSGEKLHFFFMRFDQIGYMLHEFPIPAPFP